MTCRTSEFRDIIAEHPAAGDYPASQIAGYDIPIVGSATQLACESFRMKEAQHSAACDPLLQHCSAHYRR